MTDDNNSGRIPIAPYPPFIPKQSGRGRNRPGVAGGPNLPVLSSPAGAANTANTANTTNTTNTASAGGAGTLHQGNKTAFTSQATSSPSIGTPQQQQQQQQSGNFQKSRQHPGKIEFFNSNLYGAINCLGHNNNSFESATNFIANRSRTSTNFGSSSKLKKSGPILLELRCLHQRSDSDDEEERERGDNIETIEKEKKSEQIGRKQLYSWYQGNTVAVTRGIASTSITSTCLSFRQSCKVTKNIVSSSFSGDDHNKQNSKEIYNDTIHCATGLSNGALCIHTIKNLNDYIARSMDEDEMKLNNSSSILDSADSEDAKVAYLSHQHTKHNRPVSAVKWRCGSSGSNSAYSNHVAIGYNSSQQGEREFRGGGGVSGQRSPPPQRDTYLSGFFAYVWDVEAQSNAAKGKKQRKLAYGLCVSFSLFSSSQ